MWCTVCTMVMSVQYSKGEKDSYDYNELELLIIDHSQDILLVIIMIFRSNY